MNNIFVNYYTIFRKTKDNIHTDKWTPEPVNEIRSSVSLFHMFRLYPVSDIVRTVG